MQIGWEINYSDRVVKKWLQGLPILYFSDKSLMVCYDHGTDLHESGGGDDGDRDGDSLQGDRGENFNTHKICHIECGYNKVYLQKTL